MMFGGACRSRIADKAHCDPDKHEGFHQIGQRLRIPGFQVVYGSYTFFDGIQHQLADLRTAVFPVDNLRQLPVADREVFPEHVSESRRDHVHRSCGEIVGIPDNRRRTVGRISDLQVVMDDRAHVRRIAVHARGGSDDIIRNSLLK